MCSRCEKDIPRNTHSPVQMPVTFLLIHRSDNVLCCFYRHVSHKNVVRLIDAEAPHLKYPDDTLGNGRSSRSRRDSGVKRVRTGDRSLDDIYLIFELVDTDMNKIILSSQFLTTTHVQTFLYQILKGLLYLHSANVIHR